MPENNAIGKIKEHVEERFASAPQSSRTLEMKDELYNRLLSIYIELLESGRDSETAFNLAVQSTGEDTVKRYKVVNDESKPADESKKINKKSYDAMVSAYWLVVVAVYLFYSFNFRTWRFSWILFLLAAAGHQLLEAYWHNKH